MRDDDESAEPSSDDRIADPPSDSPPADAPDDDAASSGPGNGHRTQDIPGRDDTPTGIVVSDLAQTLLHSEIARDDKPGNRFAYPWWAMGLVSVFVLAHAAILLVHNLPSKGLARGTQKFFDKHLKMNKYFRATGNTQSWAMFAPNPHRNNIFMRVEVIDEEGNRVDLEHDIYGRRKYPYLWYDRRGKINRRIIDADGYRRHYAAWVCRKWERDHGELPDEVVFTKLWTNIPSPREVYKKTGGRPWLGYDPMKLHLSERESDTIRCSSTRHAQLPNYLRQRYGMEPMPEDHFRGMHIRTWVDIAEDRRSKGKAD